MRATGRLCATPISPGSPQKRGEAELAQRGYSPALMHRSLFLLVSGWSLLACQPQPPSEASPATPPAQEASPSAEPSPAPGAAAAKAPVSGTFAIDSSKSSISFVGANVLSSHNGSFKNFSGTVDVGPSGPTSIQVEIDVTSVFVDHPKLLAHLQQEDFFFVEKYPSASFKSTAITPSKKADATHMVTGDFTIRGVTKSETFPIRVAQSERGWSGSASFPLKRLEFGIAYKGAADNLVKPEVPLTLELVAKPAT